ncbi:hypothetical protein PoB_002442500 [Plakobranchus ocellatus]|uniref:Uncharacterized protein n=1 Tax=Plakobranchus ocellatus TaxID=259542 RepID=A0AAV3ZS50_9GAST|nr:hypothetical protein PoB_002442500 [Plakobranchus ocellatus]
MGKESLGKEKPVSVTAPGRLCRGPTEKHQPSVTAPGRLRRGPPEKHQPSVIAPGRLCRGPTEKHQLGIVFSLKLSKGWRFPSLTVSRRFAAREVSHSVSANAMKGWLGGFPLKLVHLFQVVELVQVCPGVIRVYVQFPQRH